jgi:hypothetical protein
MDSRVLGVVEMKARVAAINAAMAHKIAGALTLEAEAIMATSKMLAPVDTGVMRQSGFVGAPTSSGTTHSIELGYGGAAAGYVIYVHEDLSKRHAAPTQAKFLEQPLREAAPHLLENIALRIALDKS